MKRRPIHEREHHLDEKQLEHGVKITYFRTIYVLTFSVILNFVITKLIFEYFSFKDLDFKSYEKDLSIIIVCLKLFDFVLNWI